MVTVDLSQVKEQNERRIRELEEKNERRIRELEEKNKRRVSELEEKNKEQISELEEKVNNCLKDSQSLRNRIYAATWVASFLGVLTILNGGYVKYVSGNVDKLANKNKGIEQKISIMERKANDALIIFDEKKKEVVNDIESIAEAEKEKIKSEIDVIFNEKIQKINNFSDLKKKEISNISIHKIKNNLSSIRLKSMVIVNNDGENVLLISTDNEGNGAISVRSKEGHKLLTITEEHNKGAVTYYDHSGHSVNRRTETYDSRIH